MLLAPRDARRELVAFTRRRLHDAPLRCRRATRSGPVAAEAADAVLLWLAEEEGCLAGVPLVPLASGGFGVVGCSYYWLMYIREPRLQLDAWPPLTYTEGCAGGEPRTVLVGYLTNVFLLLLFVRFFRAAYKRRTPGSKLE